MLYHTYKSGTTCFLGGGVRVSHEYNVKYGEYRSYKEAAVIYTLARGVYESFAAMFLWAVRGVDIKRETFKCE